MSRAAGLALMVLAIGCSDSGGGSCPEPRPVVGIQSGELQSAGGNKDTCSGCSAKGFPPHEGVSPIEMQIDADNDRVVLRYQRDGRQVEEVWRIGARFEL